MSNDLTHRPNRIRNPGLDDVRHPIVLSHVQGCLSHVVWMVVVLRAKDSCKKCHWYYSVWRVSLRAIQSAETTQRFRVNLIHVKFVQLSFVIRLEPAWNCLMDKWIPRMSKASETVYFRWYEGTNMRLYLKFLTKLSHSCLSWASNSNEVIFNGMETQKIPTCIVEAKYLLSLLRRRRKGHVHYRMMSCCICSRKDLTWCESVNLDDARKNLWHCCRRLEISSRVSCIYKLLPVRSWWILSSM